MSSQQRVDLSLMAAAPGPIPVQDVAINAHRQLNLAGPLLEAVSKYGSGKHAGRQFWRIRKIHVSRRPCPHPRPVRRRLVRSMCSLHTGSLSSSR